MARVGLARVRRAVVGSSLELKATGGGLDGVGGQLKRRE